MTDPLEFGLELTESMDEEATAILTPEALRFVAKLDNRFAGCRRDLLDARRTRREELASGDQVLEFLPQTRGIRNDDSWGVAPPAAGLEDRRVELIGPPDRSTAEYALNSGAQVWLADFSDSLSPTWTNILNGQKVLYDAIRRNLGGDDTEQKMIRNPATIVVGTRGWHLVDKHIRIDGRPVSASLVDFGLYFFHNARQLIARGKAPYFLLPQLESHDEARLWNDVFCFAQRELGIPRGSVRATVRIDTVTAAFEMEEILFELREHAAGLAVSRWNYLSSIVRTFTDQSDVLLPDSAKMALTAPFLQAYTDLLVRTCHKRGAYAIAETAPFPFSTDGHLDGIAEDLRRYQERAAGECFDGLMVEHPGLVPVARSVFDEVLGGWPNQLGKLREDVVVTAEELLNLAVAEDTVSEHGVRVAITTAVRYFAAWLQGIGSVETSSMPTTAAVAEFCRCQVWQWVHNGGRLSDGTVLTRDLVQSWLTEEVQSLRNEFGDAGRVEDAREIFLHTALGEQLPNFFTTGAYARYLAGAS